MAQSIFLQPHTYEWPPVGSINHLRSWTFETGTAIFEAQRRKYGRGSDAPPLSPKSKLVQILLEEPLASPTTILDRRPISSYERNDNTPPTSYPQKIRDEHSGVFTQVSHSRVHFKHTYPDFSPDPRLNKAHSNHGPPKAQAPAQNSEQCYSCGIVCYNEGTRPRYSSDESGHWFIDVHNGLRRKVAYIFCATCVSLLMGRLQNPHLGCGHLPSPVSLNCPEECMPMFCGKCRGDIGRGLGVCH